MVNDIFIQFKILTAAVTAHPVSPKAGTKHAVRDQKIQNTACLFQWSDAT